MGSRKNDIRGAGHPESWKCIDCRIDTAPGCQNAAQIEQSLRLMGKAMQTITPYSEIYMVHSEVWAAARMGPMSGCLCIGCLETRLGRTLTPADFPKGGLNSFPGTARLKARQGRRGRA
jgi:hypothetical protein